MRWIADKDGKNWNIQPNLSRWQVLIASNWCQRKPQDCYRVGIISAPTFWACETAGIRYPSFAGVSIGWIASSQGSDGVLDRSVGLCVQTGPVWPIRASQAHSNDSFFCCVHQSKFCQLFDCRLTGDNIPTSNDRSSTAVTWPKLFLRFFTSKMFFIDNPTPLLGGDSFNLQTRKVPVIPGISGKITDEPAKWTSNCKYLNTAN